MRRAPSNARPARAGFTLVEVLAAFIVLALMTIAIQNGVTSAASSIAAARSRFAAQTVAASLANGPAVVPAGGAGRSAGSLDGYDWTIEFDTVPRGRFGAGRQIDEGFPWTPVEMRVSVRSPGGSRPLATIQTIRLVQVAP